MNGTGGLVVRGEPGRRRDAAGADRQDGRRRPAEPGADQGIGDKVAAYFVPAVVSSAYQFYRVGDDRSEAAHGYAMVNAVAVLIIACPCALGSRRPCQSWLARVEARQPEC